MAVPTVVTFNAPRSVSLDECASQPLTPDGVRIATWYSGISAGTELTAYRGTNPYLTGTWDAELRLFRDGEPTFAYPVSGWGYSEMGEVLEVGVDGSDRLVRPRVPVLRIRAVCVRHGASSHRW